jgi:hypothetical protein
MKPDNSIIKGGVPAGGSARALVEAGKACAIYVREPGTNSIALQVQLSEGKWSAEWIDTKTGEIAGKMQFTGSGTNTVNSPAFNEDIALRILKR